MSKKKILTEEDRSNFLAIIEQAIEATQLKIRNSLEIEEASYEDQLSALKLLKGNLEKAELTNKAMNLSYIMKEILNRQWLSYENFAYLPATILKDLINYDAIHDKTYYLLTHAELRDAIATLDDSHPMKNSAQAILTDIERELHRDFSSLNRQELSVALNETRKMIVNKPGETKNITQRTQDYQRYVNRIKRAGTLRYILAGLCVLLAIAAILSLAFTGVGAIPAAFVSLAIASVVIKIVGASALTLVAMSLFATGAQKRNLANTMSTLTRNDHTESIEMTKR